VLNLRLRQAEYAVGDGRLDEACELLKDEATRNHRRGQRLVGKLIEALVKRGRAHLEVGRLGSARSDCEKAAALGGNQEQVGALRSEVVLAGEALERSRRRAGAAVAEARVCLDRGDYSKGAAALKGMDDGADPRIGEALAAGRANRDDAVRRAEAAIKREDWDAAAAALVNVGPGVDEGLIERVRVGLEGLAWSDLKNGRLDRVGVRLDRLASLGLDRVRQEELDGVMDDCRLASWWIEKGDLREAGVVLGRLKLRLKGAGWLDEATGLVNEAEKARAGLVAGPLGLTGMAKPRTEAETQLSMGRHVAPRPRRRPVGADRRAVASPVVHGHPVHRCGGEGTNGMADRFMLQVDGGGRCLVCRGGRVTMGAGGRFDVALVGRGSSVGPMDGAGGVVIERVEDDWFLRGPGEASGVVKVNGRLVGDCLLSDGDRIEIAGCGEMKFGQPVASSPTAVLRLTGAKLGRRDVRRVVLMAGAVVIGAGGASHVKSDLVDGALVLREEDDGHGRLRCGAMGGRGGVDRGRVLVTGEPAEVGGVGVMVAGW
jgi:hypothetical protein